MHAYINAHIHIQKPTHVQAYRQTDRPPSLPACLPAYLPTYIDTHLEIDDTCTELEALLALLVWHSRRTGAASEGCGASGRQERIQRLRIGVQGSKGQGFTEELGV